MGADERVLIGLVSVTPATGDIIYDEFIDSHMRSELEVCHILHFSEAPPDNDDDLDTHGSYTTVRTPTSFQ